MTTDAEIVNLCAAIYDPLQNSSWDHFWPSIGGICAGIKDNVLIFRGSITAQDWIRDLLAFPSPVKNHPEFGIIHAGFDEDMDEFFKEASQFLRDGARFGGHSLGAARAWLAAGRYILQGGSPAGITVFGSPKPGGLQFGQFLAPYKKSSYRNGKDPVPAVPFWIGEEIAIEPIDFQQLNVEPTDWSEGLMAWHNIHLYQQGLNA